MKTLFDSCALRESVFDETKRDDTLDLSNLIENLIDVDRFFNETYITNGMQLLLENAFKRFTRKGTTGIFRLTQSMGGGKTHNMIMLGLLAKHPEYREKILKKEFLKNQLGKIKVVAFTGRESDAPFGIWGEIARQLGKQSDFSSYYAPLKAPGQTAWINLLRGEPLLILLDEIPPYLVSCKATTIGNSDLAQVTITALSNLFNALAKEELANVCLVISDLKANYESGSELLQSAFKELGNEVDRIAHNIEPVSSATDEVYSILKKRLFKTLPSEQEIIEIAKAYREEIKRAKQMGYTNASPEQTFIGIREAYPFHPSIKHLFARFKDNPNFQQTRGLIRFMRLLVAQLYEGELPEAKRLHLINAYNYNINNFDMFSTLKEIKTSLVPAITYDISANGKAIAEDLAKNLQDSTILDVSKLLLIASLSVIPNMVLGLSFQEVVSYLCEPGRDITLIKTALEEFKIRAWYLYMDKNLRYFFKDVKNVNAELLYLAQNYDNEIAKKEIKTILSEKFKPVVGDLYQAVEVFPPIDEIKLLEDKTTLVVTEPNLMGSGLQKDILDFFKSIKYKNRIMFLTGQRNSMDDLLNTAKEHRAISEILKRMLEDKVPEEDNQFQQAIALQSKIILNLLSSARETFVTLYFPFGNNDLESADILMEFSNNEFKGEKQIKDVLIENFKYEIDTNTEEFLFKCEQRLFTQKVMRWKDVLEKAATNTHWPWHHSTALEDLKDNMLHKEIWREQEGGYIEKPPFPKPKTAVEYYVLSRDHQTGRVKLRLEAINGTVIHYEIDSPATSSSLTIENPNEFYTDELSVSFICVDTTGEHETGEAVYFHNEITLSHRIYNKDNKQYVELKAVPPVTIKYTTDGSSPKEHGGIYHEDFLVPEETKYVLAIGIAEKQHMESDVKTINISKIFTVPTDIPVRINRKFKTDSTTDTYKIMKQLKNTNAQIAGVSTTIYGIESKAQSWVEINFDSNMKIDMEQLERQIDNVRGSFMVEKKVNVSLSFSTIFFETGQDFLGWIAENKWKSDDFKNEIAF